MKNIDKRVIYVDLEFENGTEHWIYYEDSKIITAIDVENEITTYIMETEDDITDFRADMRELAECLGEGDLDEGLENFFANVLESFNKSQEVKQHE